MNAVLMVFNFLVVIVALEVKRVEKERGNVKKKTCKYCKIATRQ